MFGLSSSIPRFAGVFCGLVCEAVGKADLLSCNLDGTQLKNPVDLSSTSHCEEKYKQTIDTSAVYLTN